VKKTHLGARGQAWGCLSTEKLKGSGGGGLVGGDGAHSKPGVLKLKQPQHCHQVFIQLALPWDARGVERGLRIYASKAPRYCLGPHFENQL
jgi:hypothetical protein